MSDPLVQRGMIEIGPGEAPRNGQRIGLIDAESEPRSKRKASESEDEYDRQGKGSLARRLGRLVGVRRGDHVADHGLPARGLQQQVGPILRRRLIPASAVIGMRSSAHAVNRRAWGQRDWAASIDSQTKTRFLAASPSTPGMN